METNDGSKPIQYTANDWFYLKTEKGEVCDSKARNTKCAENENIVTYLQKSTDNLGASMTQYNDAKMLYNRELLFSINILIGLAMLLYYIYLNQNVIPNVSSLIPSLNMRGVPAVNTKPPVK